MKGALQLLSLSAIDKLSLLRYLREFSSHVSDGDHQQFTHATRNNSEEVIEVSKLKLSFIMGHSTNVIRKRCGEDDDMLTPTGYPPPPNTANRHGPQRT